MLTPIQVKRNKAFIAALRSGKYRQVNKALRHKVSGKWGYCCLGVACEIYRLDAGIGKWYAERFGEATGYPPSAVAEGYYGWPTNNPPLPLSTVSPVGTDEAASLNDDKKWDFPKIADAFEAWLKENAPKRKPAVRKKAN